MPFTIPTASISDDKLTTYGILLMIHRILSSASSIMLAKFGPVLTFILAVALVVLLAVTVYFQRERANTEDFMVILPDNDRNIPSHSYDPSKAYYNYEVD